ADDAALAEAERLVGQGLALAAELGHRAAPPSGASAAWAASAASAALAGLAGLAAEPETAAWQLAAIAPLGPLDRQRLLETSGHGPRLRTLAAMVAEEISVLAHRLGG